MKWQKSILAYLFILLIGFSVFFTPKIHQNVPIHNIETSQKHNHSEQKDNKDTGMSESHDTVNPIRAGVEFIVYHFLDAVPVFDFAKAANKEIPKLYFARILMYSFPHVERRIKKSLFGLVLA